MIYSIEIPPGFRLCGLEETGKGFRAYLKRRHDASGFLHGAIDTTPQAAIDLCHKEFLVRETSHEVVAPAAPRFKLDLSSLTRKVNTDV